MRKLGIILSLLMLSSLLAGLISCGQTTPTTPTIPTTPTTPVMPTALGAPTEQKPFKPIVLKFGDARASGPEYLGYPSGYSRWVDAVEGATQGRIKIEAYWSGSLLNNPIAEMQVGAGVADLGYGSRLSRGILPIKDILRLPPLHGETTAMENLMIHWFVLYDYLKKDDEKMNLIDMGPLHLHPYLMTTARKPVPGIKDVRGLTLMSTDAMTIKLLSGLGAIMVPVPTLEGFEALQKGVADGAIWNWGGPFVFRWIDAYKPGYFIDIGGGMRGGGSSNALMNKAKYESLPKDLRDLLDYTIWRWASVYFAAQIDGSSPLYLGESEKRGIKYLVWSDEDKALFVKEKEKIVDAWIEEMEKLYKRGAEAAELVKVYNEAARRYVPPAPVPLQVKGGGAQTEWDKVFGPGSTWGAGYKAYPNQTGLHTLEGNVFKPWK